jgi:hypothetical protein
MHQMNLELNQLAERVPYKNIEKHGTEHIDPA